MEPQDVNQAMKEYANKYPPMLTLVQAAEIIQRPLATLYDWSHRGRFDSFKQRNGREIRLLRDPFLRFFLGGQSAIN